MRRTPLLAFGIAVVVPVILAACGGGGPGATPSPTPTVASTATPTATPTPAPTAEPTATPTPSPTPVLSPCEAVPALPTTVTDQPNLYSITVPDGWVITSDEGARGLRVSSIFVESPDFYTVVVEEPEGPFNPVYYETGAALSIHVGTPSSSPYHFQELISESDVTIDVVTAPYHVYVDPSTWAGQLIDAHANHGGNDYTFDFAYNPDTCPAGDDLFRAMLDSFQFN